MTYRGANAVGDNLAIDYKNANLLVNPANLSNYEHIVNAIGGAGFFVNKTSSHSNGQAVLAGSEGIMSCGGGGAGAYKGGCGAAGTSYSGGPGGAGSHTLSTNCDGKANGGAGGYGYGSSSYGGNYGNGGAGNPGGGSSYGYSGSTGTGGLLVLVINGNLSIGPNGVISSNGANGGSGGKNSAGGGGAGGGCIKLLYTGEYTNNGSIQANGGIGGGVTFYGGNGVQGL